MFASLTLISTGALEIGLIAGGLFTNRAAPRLAVALGLDGNPPKKPLQTVSKGENCVKPSVFVACSRESLDIAYAVQEELEYDAEVTLWPQSVFKPSTYTLDELTKQLHRFDFAIFLFSPDDAVEIKGKRRVLPRDNVIFEFGMFVSRLGRERCFIVAPRNEPDLRIPTDLTGINTLTYDAKRSDSNLRAALGPACNNIRTEITRKGKIGLPKETQQQWIDHPGRVSTEERQELEAKIASFVTVIERDNNPACILFVDLDRFASLNRWYGEEVCNEVIKIVETTIAKSFPGHFHMRIGGDQFLVCVIGKTRAQSTRLATHLVRDIRNYAWSNLAPNLYIICSIGIAEYKPGKSVDEWIVRAIHGSVNAKKAGGNRTSRSPIEVPEHLRVKYELMLS